VAAVLTKSIVIDQYSVKSCLSVERSDPEIGSYCPVLWGKEVARSLAFGYGRLIFDREA